MCTGERINGAKFLGSAEEDLDVDLALARPPSCDLVMEGAAKDSRDGGVFTQGAA